MRISTGDTTSKVKPTGLTPTWLKPTRLKQTRLQPTRPRTSLETLNGDLERLSLETLNKHASGIRYAVYSRIQRFTRERGAWPAREEIPHHVKRILIMRILIMMFFSACPWCRSSRHNAASGHAAVTFG